MEQLVADFPFPKDQPSVNCVFTGSDMIIAMTLVFFPETTSCSHYKLFPMLEQCNNNTSPNKMCLNEAGPHQKGVKHLLHVDKGQVT